MHYACTFLAEAPQHPHIQQRQTFVEIDGVVQAAPSPHFRRTLGAIQYPAPSAGQDTDEVLADWGFSANELEALRAGGPSFKKSPVP